MRVVAFMTLHYGADYLAQSIASIIDDVDAVWCLYTPDGSFGGAPEYANPDSAETLFDIAQASAGDKFHWYTGSPGQWRNEGQHCDFIYTCEPNADAYVRLDADEIWTPGLLANALDFARSEGLYKVRLPMIHYWRSLYRAVLHDTLIPDRVTQPAARGDARVGTLHDKGVIHHFGYAQRSEVVRYKQALSSHRAEWRNDWYRDKFEANALSDVHPVIFNHWTPELIDPFAHGLPDAMREHPFVDMEVIP